VVNRGALILRYKEPAVRWINEADPNPSAPPIDLQSANEDRNVYLISDSAGDDRQSLDRWLKRHYVEIFEIELEDGYTDPNLWPKMIGGKHPLYLEILDRLGEALAHDQRFSEVQWSTLDEFEPTISRHQNPTS